MCDYKKKIALHLTSLNYLHDYLAMGVGLFVVGGSMSAFTSLKLTDDELQDLVKRLQGSLLYVEVNGLYDEHELDDLKKHLDALHEMGIPGILFQDFGVLRYCQQKHYDFDLMYAPQTLNTNPMTLNTLRDLGVSSAVVAKEIPLEDQLSIREHTAMPLMLQVHGVSYMMSSKRHLLTTYQEWAHVETDAHDFIIQPRDSSQRCHIYEDERGTTVYTESKIYMLDLFNRINVFDYFYIETMYMDDREILEVTSLYCDCLKAYHEGRYDQYIKEYMPLLRAVSKPLDRGFIEDHTIYHLDDVKRRDNHGA